MAVASERRVRRDAGFGLRLTEAMDRRRVRPGELALSQAVGAGTVSRWRKGECPDDLRFPRLAVYLQVPEEWLKTGPGRATGLDGAHGRGEKGRGRRRGARRAAGGGLRAGDPGGCGQARRAAGPDSGFRDSGKAPSPEILSEWLAIVQANSLPVSPGGA